MGVRIEHGKPSTLLTVAQMKGEERAAQQQLERTERLQAQQREFEYRTAIRQQDMTIDLQMQERAKQWEIQKMELRSQVDFQREEQARQRKLDNYDNALSQIDKEVLAGRMTEREAYPLKLKYEMEKMGVDAPVSLLPAGGEEERYGVDPYWMRGKDAPEGTPERQLYEAKLAEGISGERRGTVPYYLDPTFIGNYPEASRQAQEARGIFLSDEEFNAMARGETARLPLGDKQLDIGVQAETPTEGQVRIISPTGEEGTIPVEDLEDALAEGYTLTTAKEPLPTPQITKEQAQKKYEEYRHPSFKKFVTQSPLKTALEMYGLRNK